MNVWRGGPGVKAPYETTHVRIPVPIKEVVEKLSADYKQGKFVEPVNAISLDEALEEARKILRAKKSKLVSVQSLLTAIYGVDIEL